MSVDRHRASAPRGWNPLPVLALTFVAGCAGPAGPSTVAAAAPTLLFRSGPKGAPLAGILVEVGGVAATTDASGRLTSPVAPGTPIRVTVPGSLPRETRAGLDNEVVLWPEGDSVPRDDTWDLVYSATPAQELTRVEASQVWLRLAPALADPAIRATLEQAASLMSEASGIAYVVGDAPKGAVVFDVGLDPGLATGVLGHTSVRSRAGIVLGGQVTFKDEDAARRLNTVLHELGHTFGLLGHSRDPRNVLYASASSITSFSPAERAILAMMRRRRPGNRFPDIELGVAQAATASPAMAVAD